MLIPDLNININIVFFNRNNLNTSTPIIFLHGFTGSTGDWLEVTPLINKNFTTLSFDMIGHGKSASPKDISYYNTDSIVFSINEIINTLNLTDVILAGYSMGGRAALSYAIKYPEKIKALILESSTPGIIENNLREERLQSDLQLANFIENNSINHFIDYWMSIDLFKTQKQLPQNKLNDIKKSKLMNSTIGLANSLRGFSTGIMPAMFDQLSKITSKVLLITGELDAKFTTLNSEIVSLFASATHQIIKDAGHNIHLEKPSEYAEVINNFLSEF